MVLRYVRILFRLLFYVLALDYPSIILGASVLTIISYAVYNLFFTRSLVYQANRGQNRSFSWKSTRAVKLDMGWRLLELHARHGTIVRIARNEASICESVSFMNPQVVHLFQCLCSSPSAISQIYKFNPS
ncbi:hypothetical protein B0H10DRAFT_579268 [Mycena sp. CBHHK59/15]|nr:hypothetical protein B0H10DRAFT_579268 [Mycena sp. CBHHK59/15]